MTIRWGLLGVGDIANKRVAAAIQNDPKSELVAVCRRDETKLQQFADQFGVCHRMANASEMIASNELDAIYIATPVDLHCPQTIAAAGAGKHVMVEKPMAIDPQQCDQMITACEAAGVTLGVAYYRRFYPVVRRIQTLIQSGLLGRVLSISAVTGNTNRFEADNWRVVRSRGGGGPLMDIGSHRLDVFLQLLGPVSQVKSNVIESDEFEAEQVSTVMMQFASGANGVLQCYFGTTNTPDRLEVIGTDGRISVEDLNQGDLVVHTNSGQKKESHPPHENLHAPLIEDFSRAIIEDRPPAITGIIGRQTNQIIQLAYQDAMVESLTGVGRASE